MTIGEFAETVATLRRKYGASETSGGRTDARSVTRGGFAGGPHGWDLARDWVYDTGVRRAGTEGHVKSPHSCPECSEAGIKVIHELTHDHLQPADFPAGPVTQYAGMTRTWA